MKPKLRRQLAGAHIVGSLLGGVAASIWLATSGFERVLMAISWYAIFITAIDVYQTTDVRTQQENDAGTDRP